MLKTLLQYAKDECIPRWKDILGGAETTISCAAMLFFLLFGTHFFSVSPKVNDISTGLIAYAAIVLGFCVSGLTLSLTLPDRGFAEVLANAQAKDKSRNAYSDLLFVFSWTAVVHWIAVLALFTIILFAEAAQALLPTNGGPIRVLIVSFVAGLCVYCFCQFLITLITLSQVGNRYIEHLRSHPNPTFGAK